MVPWPFPILKQCVDNRGIKVQQKHVINVPWDADIVLDVRMLSRLDEGHSLKGPGLSKSAAARSQLNIAPAYSSTKHSKALYEFHQFLKTGLDQ
uniref:SFRICE_036872 n=1 Tax=Spodoptera frugiperda TaxID=7108 RepID=A0A2H1UZY1_SPOFR